MSVTNNAIRAALGAGVEVVAGPAAAQGTATKLTNAFCRAIGGVATGSFILPSILSGEATRPITLVNDTAVAVGVFPAVGEKINGTLNTSIAVAAGASVILYPVLNSVLNYPSTLDWRGAVIT